MALRDKSITRERYIPESRYEKSKTTPGGEFAIASTGEDYRGSYFKTFDGKYYSGTRPENNGVELVEITPNYLEDLIPAAATIAGLLVGFFIPKLKKGDKEKGSTKRYFVKDKRKGKIIETDLQTYQQAQELPSIITAEVDWIIKGPAEDKIINGYPFEGAASKNKKAIQALEKQMPGISIFVTDYSLLVEEPVNAQERQLSSQTIIEEDPQIALQNSRKANFDKRL